MQFSCSTWAPDNLIPTCLFGSCVNSSCVCRQGFQNDFVMGRYANCGLPIWAPWTFCGLSLCFSTVSFLYGLITTIRRAVRGTILWRIAFFSTLASLLFVLSLISLATAGFLMPWYGSFFTSSGAAVCAHVAGLVIISALRPINAFDHHLLKNPEIFENILQHVSPAVLFFGLMICIGVGYGIGTNFSITQSMGGVFLVIGICAALAFPFLLVFLSKLYHAISQVSSSQSTQKEALSKLKIKVRALRFTSSLSSFATAILCFIASGLQFTLFTIPLSWCIYFAFVIALSLFNLQMAHYAHPSRKDKSSVISEARSGSIIFGAHKESLAGESLLSSNVKSRVESV